jgi:CBS domain-containing protein
MRKVASVMTREPLCASLYQPVDEVAELMAVHDTGFVPVLRDGKLAGVITDRDIVVRVLASRNDPARTPVCEAATADVIWVTPEMPVDEAVRLMELNKIRRVVVMEGERVAGVVSLGDLAEALPETAEHALVEISKSPKTLAHRG